MSNHCVRDLTLNNWRIEVLQPAAGATSADTFQYKATRIGTANDASNLRVCVCPDLTDEERSALFETCQWTASSSEGSETSGSGECSLSNQIPNENENPAACKGIKFEGFPEEIGGEPVNEIIFQFTLTDEVAVGPTDIGLKAGNPGSSAVFEDMCGPVCGDVPPPPPTRGIPF